MKKKLNWKGWIFLIIIISMILLLIFTLPCITNLFTFNEWIKTIVIGGIISVVSSLIVSLIFTIKMEKQDYIKELELEINNLFASYFTIQDKTIEIIYNVLMPPKIKLARLLSLYSIKPDLSVLKLEYPNFTDLYKQKIDKIVSEINLINSNDDKEITKTLNNIFPKIEFHHAEINNELLKVQERFYQRYKGAPKKEIKDELVFKDNNPKE